MYIHHNNNAGYSIAMHYSEKLTHLNCQNSFQKIVVMNKVYSSSRIILLDQELCVCEHCMQIKLSHSAKKLYLLLSYISKYPYHELKLQFGCNLRSNVTNSSPSGASEVPGAANSS